MINQPEQIVARVRELRGVLDIPAADAAAALGVDERTYLDYESGALDLPINALYKLAELFRVDVTELLTGESPRMADYTVVRAGKGAKVDRYPGYDFESLAANFRHSSSSPCSSISPPTPTKPTSRPSSNTAARSSTTSSREPCGSL